MWFDFSARLGCDFGRWIASRGTGLVFTDMPRLLRADQFKAPLSRFAIYPSKLQLPSRVVLFGRRWACFQGVMSQNRIIQLQQQR
jgi:hypothetical protein